MQKGAEREDLGDFKELPYRLRRHFDVSVSKKLFCECTNLKSAKDKEQCCNCVLQVLSSGLVFSGPLQCAVVSSDAIC